MQAKAKAAQEDARAEGRAQSAPQALLEPRLDRGADRLDDLDPRVALVLGLDEVPGRALVLVRSTISSIAASYCAACERLRQSSSVSFHDFSGSFSRALKRLSCSSSETCSQNLTRIIPSSHSARSKSLISP